MLGARRRIGAGESQHKKASVDLAAETSIMETPIRVVVRIRPLNEEECSQPLGAECILKAMDRHVVAFDPPPENIKRVSGTRVSTRSSTRRYKDLKYAFDIVFDQDATQQEVYEISTKGLVDNVLDGFNATVFAYGVSFFF
jgi:hypothetical protein